MSAIAETGPGQHFLGSGHTRLNFMDALFRPATPDNNSFEQWQAEGSKDAAQRANGLWKKHLERYEDPGLDPAIDEALQDYIGRVKASQPDMTYF
jgi:trimethylamine--corrinoid protein Co-methyltransferase